jgi:hypothetical protein
MKKGGRPTPPADSAPVPTLKLPSHIAVGSSAELFEEELLNSSMDDDIDFEADHDLMSFKPADLEDDGDDSFFVDRHRMAPDHGRHVESKASPQERPASKGGLSKAEMNERKVILSVLKKEMDESMMLMEKVFQSLFIS